MNYFHLSQVIVNHSSTLLSTGTFSPMCTRNNEYDFDSSDQTILKSEQHTPQTKILKRSASNSSTLQNLMEDLQEENSNISFDRLNSVHVDQMNYEPFSMMNYPDQQNPVFDVYPPVNEANQYNYQTLPQEYQQNNHFIQNSYLPNEPYQDYLSLDSNIQEDNEYAKISDYDYAQNPTNSQSEKTNLFEQDTASKIYQNKSDKDELVRHRSKITMRRLPHSVETVTVQERTQEKKKQFKNHFKNFLKKAIPYLSKKLQEFNAGDEDYEAMLQILASFQNKTSKDDVLFLIKNFPTLEEQEFNRLMELNRDQSEIASVREQKINPNFRALLFSMSHIEDSDSYEEYKQIAQILRKLNTFNRKWLLRFTMVDYIPTILRIKANKQDQFFTNNYIRHVLTNASIIE